jgi:hypothetical protein
VAECEFFVLAMQIFTRLISQPVHVLTGLAACSPRHPTRTVSRFYSRYVGQCDPQDEISRSSGIDLSLCFPLSDQSTCLVVVASSAVVVSLSRPSVVFIALAEQRRPSQSAIRQHSAQGRPPSGTQISVEPFQSDLAN